MFKALKRMARGYERYMTFRGRVLAREHLLRYDDHMLADCGFSRELLEKGLTGWPWRTETEHEALLSDNTTLTSQKQAITDLKALSDAELQDLGISRGTIEQAVASGRENLIPDRQLKVA